MDNSIVDRIVELAVQIQQIPSPTFYEEKRAEFIRNRFQALGAKEVSVDDCGNVFIHLLGRGEKPPLVVSAHLDTVFPSGTDLTCVRREDRIFGPGIGDNSLGLAALFGLYWHFCGDKGDPTDLPALRGDLWLVADVREEGLGDLKGMKAVVDRFGSEPLGYVVIEGMSLGQIYTRGLGVRRYCIRVDTKGGHSWVDYGSPSAIHEIAELVIKLKALPVPKEPRSSMNVGIIKGGTSVNTIAAEASLELDLRSENVAVLDQMITWVESLVRRANQEDGEAVRVNLEVIGARPPGEIKITHPLVKTAVECYAKENIEVKLKIGSTDANIPLSLGFPAICMGLTSGGGTHTLREYIDTKPVTQGFRILVDFIQSSFEIGNGITYRAHD